MQEFKKKKKAQTTDSKIKNVAGLLTAHMRLIQNSWLLPLKLNHYLSIKTQTVERMFPGMQFRFGTLLCFKDDALFSLDWTASGHALN